LDDNKKIELIANVIKKMNNISDISKNDMTNMLNEMVNTEKSKNNIDMEDIDNNIDNIDDNDIDNVDDEMIEPKDLKSLFDSVSDTEISEKVIAPPLINKKVNSPPLINKKVITPKKSALYEELLTAQQQIDFKAPQDQIEMGYGMFYRPDSTFYEGQINKDGLPDGDGKQTLNEIVMFDGIYSGGLKKQGIFNILANTGAIEAQYVGTFGEHEQFHGNGKFWIKSQLKELKGIQIKNGLRLLFEGTFNKGVPTVGSLYILINTYPNTVNCYKGEVHTITNMGRDQYYANGVGELFDADNNLIESGNYINNLLNGEGQRLIDGYWYSGDFKMGIMEGNYKIADDEFEYIYKFIKNVRKKLVFQIEIYKSEEQILKEKKERDEYVKREFVMII